MEYLRWLLIPFSVLYGAVVWLRNRLYDVGWLSQRTFSVSVLVVGNLEVGGTGKTPMIEYLIRLLSPTRRVATLSRGYGRSTRGFRLVTEDSTARYSGDEPLQLKRKFSQVTVAVDADRVRGISRLQSSHEVLLLDDAFQHRAVKPGMSVLLFDFGRLKRPKVVLPAGHYRDLFSERRRADVMVVTKCPYDLSASERQEIINKLAGPRYPGPIYFASIRFSEPLLLRAGRKIKPAEMLTPGPIVVVTGIARPQSLISHLEAQQFEVEHLAFPDHHEFTVSQINRIRECAVQGRDYPRPILTTEKDAVRLMAPGYSGLLSDVEVYVVPIRMNFLGRDGEEFDRNVLTYLEGTI